MHTASFALTVTSGQPLKVEAVQPDGGRALVVGLLDSVPDSSTAGQ